MADPRFSKDSLFPEAPATLNLGSPELRWLEAFLTNLNVSTRATVPAPVNGTDAVTKTYVDGLFNPVVGTIEEVDGTPSLTNPTTLRVDQADGLVLTEPSPGVARLDLAAIPNAVLANSAVTVTAGGGLSGGGAVDLGAAVTVALAAHDHQGAGVQGGTLNAAALAAGTLPAGRFPALTGDITTIAGALATTLADTGPGATGPIGSATVTPIVTIDAKGRVTALTSATITQPAAASQAEMEAASSTTVYTTPGRTQYHPGVAKAWVLFDVAAVIYASYNITSVTDTGVGDWTVNWDVDFSSTNYVVQATPNGTAATFSTVSALAAGSARVTSFVHDGVAGDAWQFIAAFGDQ